MRFFPHPLRVALWPDCGLGGAFESLSLRKQAGGSAWPSMSAAPDPARDGYAGIAFCLWKEESLKGISACLSVCSLPPFERNCSVHFELLIEGLCQMSDRLFIHNLLLVTKMVLARQQQ